MPTLPTTLTLTKSARSLLALILPYRLAGNERADVGMRDALQAKELAALDDFVLTAVFDVGEDAVFALQTFGRLPVETGGDAAGDEGFAGVPLRRLWGTFHHFNVMNFVENNAATIYRQRAAKFHTGAGRKLPAVLESAADHGVAIVVEVIHIDERFGKGNVKTSQTQVILLGVDESLKARLDAGDDAENLRLAIFLFLHPGGEIAIAFAPFFVCFRRKAQLRHVAHFFIDEILATETEPADVVVAANTGLALLQELAAPAIINTAVRKALLAVENMRGGDFVFKMLMAVVAAAKNVHAFEFILIAHGNSPVGRRLIMKRQTVQKRRESLQRIKIYW